MVFSFTDRFFSIKIIKEEYIL